MRWLGDTSGDTRDDHVDSDGQEGGEDRGECVLGTTVLWHLDELLNDPADKVIPAEGGREGETSNNRVEGLGFQFLGHEVDSFHDLGHCEFLYYTLGKNYSGSSSSLWTIFLYLVFLMIDDFANICSSSSSESPSVLLSSSPVTLNDLYSETVQPSGSDVLITINSIF